MRVYFQVIQIGRYRQIDISTRISLFLIYGLKLQSSYLFSKSDFVHFISINSNISSISELKQYQISHITYKISIEYNKNISYFQVSLIRYSQQSEIYLSSPPSWLDAGSPHFAIPDPIPNRICKCKCKCVCIQRIRFPLPFLLYQ